MGILRKHIGRGNSKHTPSHWPAYLTVAHGGGDSRTCHRLGLRRKTSLYIILFYILIEKGVENGYLILTV